MAPSEGRRHCLASRPCRLLRADRLRRRPRRTLVVPTPRGVGQSRPRGAAEDRQHGEGRDVDSVRGIGLLDDGRSDLPRRPGLRTDRPQPARSDREVRLDHRPCRPEPTRADDRLPGPVLLPPADPGSAAALGVDRDRAGRLMRPSTLGWTVIRQRSVVSGSAMGGAWPAFAAASSISRSMDAGVRGARVPSAVPIAPRTLM